MLLCDNQTTHTNLSITNLYIFLLHKRANEINIRNTIEKRTREQEQNVNGMKFFTNPKKTPIDPKVSLKSINK